MTRLCAAGAQAAALMLLFMARTAGLWPSTQPAVFAALFMVFLFVPPIVVQAAGHLDRKRMTAWALSAALFAGIVGAHDLVRRSSTVRTPNAEALLPQAPTAAFFAGALFIIHALVLAAAADRRRIAAYSTYFELAWKQAIQAAAGGAFTLVTWIMLNLGAALFSLIHLEFFKHLIDRAWFSVPLATLAFAASLHVTDVRPQIIRSIKTVMLTLLSWLLPAATVIAGGFLLSLPFTGLAPLWATKTAAAILLACAAGLIGLLNAAYQDGIGERAVALPMRLVGTTAAILPFPLVVLAGYALALRVAQYGWTNDRVVAAACVCMAGCYAAGYLWAAASWRRWLAPLEASNVAASFVAVGLIGALFTPLADPARIAVASQMGRLEAGAVAPEQFDFISLRFDGARYGEAALRRLATSGNETVRFEANRALAKTNRYDAAEPVDMDPGAIAAGVRVNPPGGVLPESFLTQDWKTAGAAARPLANCVRRPRNQTPCDAVLADLDGDGAPEVLLFAGADSPAVFAQRGGSWTLAGTLQVPQACPAVRDALRQGAFAAGPSPWRELSAGGLNIPVVPKPADCPK